VDSADEVQGVLPASAVVEAPLGLAVLAGSGVLGAPVDSVVLGVLGAPVVLGVWVA